MKLGIYARVSTEEQSQKGTSIDDQIRRGTECSVQFSFDAYEVFKDAGISGTTPFDKRPGLNSLITKILADEIDAVFITDFDRLSRDTIQSEILKSIFIENEIKFFDSNGEIDLADENQELLTDLKSLLASFEIKKTSKRIRRVLENNAKLGKVGGGPVLNYGYTKDEDKFLVIEEEEAKIVKWIYDLCIEGKGSRVIAQTLNDHQIPTKRNKSKTGALKVRGKLKTNFVWRDSTVYRILTNPIYKGKRLYKGKTYDCPSIISAEQFEAVQEELRERKYHKDTTNRYFYLLKGRIECARCHGKMYGRKRADLSDNQYICISQRYSKSFCGNRGVNIDYLENKVWSYLKKLPEDIEKFYDWYEKTNQTKFQLMTARSLAEKEKKIKSNIDSLLELKLSTDAITLDVFNEKMNKLNVAYKETRSKKYEAVKKLGTLDSKNEILSVIRNHVQIMEDPDLTDDQRRSIVRTFVDVIYVQWIEESKTHYIQIEYKIDNLSEYKLGINLEQQYKKRGWRYDRKNTVNKTIRVRKIVTDGETGVELFDIPHVRVG